MISPLQKPRPFPHPIPAPKPKRLPKRKVPMTRVAGWRCSKGGILLCADREENDGYNRREVNKLYRINMPPGQFFIAGAGSSDMVTKAHSEITDALFKAQTNGVDLLREHQRVIEDCLRHIHKLYAANIKTAGGFDLLIVFAPFDQQRVPILYRTALAALIAVPDYAAYGSGKPICDYFSDRLYQYGRLDKDSMKILAAFVLREAEKAASGVGMGADMWFIHEGDKSVHIIPTGVIREFQALIPEIEDSLWADWKAKVKIPAHFSG